MPFSLAGLERAFVVGGGYKYCQLGEGNCFLRVPPDCRLRPVVTGWFAEFERLEEKPTGDVAYPDDPGARFQGATYDPTSHYRASEVFDFFAERGLTPELLREVSQHQLGVLCDAFDALDLPPALIDRDRTTPRERFAGFLALRSPRAGDLCAALREARRARRLARRRAAPRPRALPRRRAAGRGDGAARRGGEANVGFALRPPSSDGAPTPPD